MINFKKILKSISILFLLILFLIQAFLFVTFELATPAFVADENSHWYNSFFLLTLPFNIYFLLKVMK